MTKLTRESEMVNFRLDPVAPHAAMFRRIRLAQDKSQIDIDKATGYAQGSTSVFEGKALNAPIGKVVRMLAAVGARVVIEAEGFDRVVLDPSDYPKSNRGRDDIGEQQAKSHDAA